jgi:hypothetical protein
MDYSKLDHATLYRMRRDALDKDLQNLLAGYEHRAFAREATAQNPLLAAPIAVATPMYQAAKLLGVTDARSDPSWGQMGQGLLGVGEGLLNWARK